MKHLVVATLALLVCAASVSAQTKPKSSETKPSTKGIPTPPPGTWVEQPNTKVLDAMEKSLYGPGGLNPLSFYAYSGGVLDEVDKVLGFILFGGGHAATPDNSLIFVPLNGSGPRRLTGPYISPTGDYKYDVPGEIYKPAGIYTAAPKSRHTYHGLCVGTKKGKSTFFMNGGSLYTGAGGGSGALRMFDLTQTFKEAMARPDMGWTLTPSAAGNVATSACWDPKKKQVVIRGVSIWAAYFPDEDRMVQLNTNHQTRGSDFHTSAVIDVEGRMMYVIGDGLAESVDLDTYVWRDLRNLAWAKSGGGGGLGFSHRQNTVWGDKAGFVGGPGLDWHARTKQIVAYVNDNRLLLIDPTKDAPAKVVTMTGADATVDPNYMVFGRFRIIPGTDQVALSPMVDRNILIGTIPFPDSKPKK